MYNTGVLMAEEGVGAGSAQDRCTTLTAHKDRSNFQVLDSTGIPTQAFSSGIHMNRFISNLLVVLKLMPS
jgi:hypothetical protein